MTHKWESVDPGCSVFWCLECGTLGDGLGKAESFHVVPKQLPMILKYYIDYCAGGENPCAA